MPNTTLNKNVTYIHEYSEFSSLTVTPELAYYMMKADNGTMHVTVSDCLLWLNVTKLFNLNYIQDIVLKINKPQEPNPFNTP